MSDALSSYRSEVTCRWSPLYWTRSKWGPDWGNGWSNSDSLSLSWRQQQRSLAANERFVWRCWMCLWHEASWTCSEIMKLMHLAGLRKPWGRRTSARTHTFFFLHFGSLLFQLKSLYALSIFASSSRSFVSLLTFPASPEDPSFVGIGSCSWMSMTQVFLKFCRNVAAEFVHQDDWSRTTEAAFLWTPVDFTAVLRLNVHKWMRNDVSVSLIHELPLFTRVLLWSFETQCDSELLRALTTACGSEGHRSSHLHAQTCVSMHLRTQRSEFWESFQPDLCVCLKRAMLPVA